MSNKHAARYVPDKTPDELIPSRQVQRSKLLPHPRNALDDEWYIPAALDLPSLHAQQI